MDRSKIIFGNEISGKDYKKACKSKEKMLRKFGDDSDREYYFRQEENRILSPIGVKNLVLSDKDETDFDEKSLIVGNIRMGYGHYRISIAIASAANALGFTPYWLDLNSYPETTATKIISYQNDLYSMGSRLSQKSRLFNSLYWEPLNSEGFRKLSYNAADQKNAELMAPLLKNLPHNIPYIATHAWPSQAAIHAGMTNVVNAIPDNWPMALHLSEGSIHTVQTPSSYIGYRELRGMDKKRELKHMPADSVFFTGHYVDHEFVENIEHDCTSRLERAEKGMPRRFLLSIGGAGAQQKLFKEITEHLLKYAREGKVCLIFNVGDHRNVWDSLKKDIPGLAEISNEHIDDFDKAKEYIEKDSFSPVELFCNEEIFSAVYITNLLMRKADFLLTKPSELSFYPVPKVMLHRVGGHEAWGAIRAAEVGDGTYEIEKTSEVLSLLDELTVDDTLLKEMCSSIKVAKAAGIYNGAYEAVKIATGKRKE